MKLLLYCTKVKPMLRVAKEEFKGQKRARCYGKKETKYFTQYIEEEMYEANGKIVAECDFEVEEIELLGDEINIYYGVESRACLTTEQIENYLGYDNDYKGYAVHIKNLHIFDEPKKLSDVYKIDNVGGKLFTHSLKKAPQNMMYVSVNRWIYDFYEPSDINILISIRPEWLCKILNGEKTIEVRTKVLREMLE